MSRNVGFSKRRVLSVGLVVGLLMATGTIGTAQQAPVVADDFNDNAINSSLWAAIQIGFGPTISEKDQRLEITIPYDSGDDSEQRLFRVEYTSVCLLRGNFDIQVDYQLLEWPHANGVRVGLLTRPVSGGVDRPEKAGGSSDSVERTSFGHPRNDFPSEPREVYVTNFAAAQGPGILATDHQSGKLRQVREGNRKSGYYFSEKSGNWVFIQSSRTATADVSFSLAAWSHNYAFMDQDVRVAFDNFMVTKGELVCP